MPALNAAKSNTKPKRPIGYRLPCAKRSKRSVMAVSVGPRSWRGANRMRALEIVVALIVAGVAFVAVKLIGLVLHVAIVAAVLGLIAGFVIARALRKS